MSIKKTSQRKCIGCREMKDKTHLMRVTKAGVDPIGKIQERGAYVCKNATCVGKAQKSKGLERSLKHALPQDIYDTLKIYVNPER